MSGNEKATDIPVTRRLKVVIPSWAVLLLLATWISCSQTERHGRQAPWDAKMWLSVMSGPLACWIEFAGDFTPAEKAFYTALALILALGILCHPLWPGRATAVVTILASTMWFVWGVALTCIGV